MADDLKRVGLVFKADGAVDFKKTMQQVNTAVQENKNAFQLAKAAWDDSTTSLEKMADKQKYLQSQTETYSEKVDVLKRELELMEDAEDRNEQAIRKKKTQLTQAEIQLTKYQKGLADVTKEITSGSAKSEEEMQKFDKSIKKLDASARENESAFKLVKSQWDKNTTAAQKLKDEQGYLSNQTETYKGKLENLKEQLKLMETAEERDEQAISEKRREINETETTLNEYGKSLEEIETKLKTGAAQTEEYAEKVANIGEKSKAAGSTLTKTVTVPIVGLGTAAIKTTADFEKSMSQVAATMGMTSEEIRNGSEDYKRLEDAAREMGASTQYSASDAAEALNYLALAGYDVDKSINTLPTVLNLAAAGGIDLASASDMVTDAMSALGIESNRAEEFVDQMAKTSQKSNTNIEQLGQGILTVGGTAKVLAGGTTELNTALGILADNGTKGAEGGTALRNIILSLTAPTDTASKAIESLGLQVFDAEGNMRPLNEILKDLDGTLSTMTQGEQTQVLNTIFNKVDLKSVNALLSNSGQRFDELSGYISNANGAAGDMAATMNDNLSGQLVELQSALQELAISFGEALMPTVKGIVEKIQGFVDLLNGMDEGTRNTIIKIMTLAAVLGPLLIVFGSVCSGVSKIIGLTTSIIGIAGRVPGILSTIGTGAKFVWTVLSANPIVLIIGAVVALIAKFVTLYNKCEWFRDGVNNIFGSIKDFLGGTKKWLLHIFDFEWKLPEIKLPHFKIDGKFSLTPPSTPKIAVDWYAKGGILNSPTIFGMNGSSMMGGGEAGKEAVLPIDLLKSYIREENQANNFALAAMILEAIKELDLRAENNIYIGNSKLETILTDMVLKKMSGKMRNAMQWG